MVELAVLVDIVFKIEKLVTSIAQPKPSPALPCPA